MKSTGMLLLSGALILLGSIGLILSVSIMFDIGTPGQSATWGSAFCVLGFALPVLIGGGALLTAVLRARRRAREEAVEAIILQVALTENGRVTAAQVAMLTDLSLAEAQAYLERLARAGTISCEVGLQGMMIYNFSDAK